MGVESIDFSNGKLLNGVQVRDVIVLLLSHLKQFSVFVQFSACAPQTRSDFQPKSFPFLLDLDNSSIL
jgi:hypothetical protein